ncbi:uncharacterized protein LOC109833018 [Asparagus officinalis]|uniref:uncharacterized protein LOC109833018 n=1 Tax=Asparagus officinalis TaxID=4686 RepID=UPI00098E7BA3|nr:uncharacterized protein LOC109833018 [Asparagus officinalis]
MGFCFAVCQIEKQKKLLKKLMMVSVELISLILSYGTDYVDWVITGLTWYGIPRCIIHDNEPQFVSQASTRYCDKFRIKNLASTAYNPAANGQAEAFNKTIVRILTKVVSTNKRDWNEKLGQTLAIGMTTEESHHRRLEELEALDEKRLLAQQHIELYQARISRAFDKKVRYRTFKEGDLVLTVRRPMILNSKKKGKFEPKWKGPFIVETVYSNGPYHLITQDGHKLMMPINGKFLKKYYP